MPDTTIATSFNAGRAGVFPRTQSTAFNSGFFNALLQNSPDGIMAFDTERRCMVWNPAMEKMFGVKAQTVLGHCAFELFPAVLDLGVEKHLDAVLQGKAASDAGECTGNREGKPVRFEASYSPINGGNGCVIGVVAVLRPIASRPGVADATPASVMIQTLAQAIPHIVWITDAIGTLEYCNSRWKEYTGSSLPAAPMGWCSAVHPDHVDRVSKAWGEAFEAGETFEAEYPLRAVDGGYRWHTHRAVPLRTDNGCIHKWFASCTNVHERKLATEIFRDMNNVLDRRVDERTRALREVNEQMESFCYTVSHDLRAPLRAMRAFTQVLVEDHAPRLDATGRDFLGRVSAAAERMDRLVQDLLEYSRLGRIALALAPVATDNIIDSVLLDLRAEIAARHASVQVVKPIPHVVAHETLLHQVLLNLLSNALKFTAAGTSPVVRISAERRGDFIRVLVQDNGIGIPAEYHSRIFGVFERLHGIEAYPGTGIGLAIVQKAVERMKGQVGVQSEIGKGSCFWIELPTA